MGTPNVLLHSASSRLIQSCFLIAQYVATHRSIEYTDTSNNPEIYLLQELSLQGSTAFYGNGLCHLSPLTRLHTLDLQQCTRVDVTGLAYLAGLPRLLTVNVAKCPRIQGADFVHLSTLQEHPHLVVVGLEGSSLDVARECGFRVAPSPAAFM